MYEMTGDFSREERILRKIRMAKNRRQLMVLFKDPAFKRKVVLRRAYKSLPWWHRFAYCMGWAEFLLEEDSWHPRFRVNRAGVATWVFLLGFAALYFIFRAVAF